MGMRIKEACSVEKVIRKITREKYILHFIITV